MKALTSTKAEAIRAAKTVRQVGQLSTMVRQGLDVALLPHDLEMVQSALYEACEAAITGCRADDWYACRILQAFELIAKLETPGWFVNRAAKEYSLRRVKSLLVDNSVK